MSSTTDIITLENFASTMPPWDPNLSNHLYALVDMGSNGIRFSISDLSPPQSRFLRCIYRERAAISLFDALHKSASSGPLTFSSDVIAQVSMTLARFKSIANDYRVPMEHISVFATEAMRKAENAAEMLDAVLESSGLSVYVLAPEVETLFGSMGARSGFDTVDGLFLDLGGGSVQMTYLNSSLDDYEIVAAKTGKSLPFGAAKLMKVLESDEGEAQVAAVNSLQAGMRDAFAQLQQQFPPLRETQINQGSSGVDVFLCGGGFRGYGSLLMHIDPIQPYPIPTVGAYTVKGSFFSQTEHMRKVNAEYEAKIHGMSKRRRQQFPAIATVVEALVAAVPRIHTVTFCSGGNREGALFMKLTKPVREENPLPLLHQGNSTNLESVIHTLQSSLPDNLDSSHIPTIFTLGLGPLFASSIWARIGESNDANAAFELHQAVNRDPSAPGLSHLARAVLGLTLCYRWGASLGPFHKMLQVNLQRLVNQSNPEANFWAEYLGAIARLLAMLCPVSPDSADKLIKVVKFNSTMKTTKKKTIVQLTVSLSPATCQALDTEELVSIFKSVGKTADTVDATKMKVELTIQRGA
ncbi:Ppx/GppA phosphatase family-domain-containing protein [Daldinia caldariorum]|uniref:Ppx/GppA phosphatase family-domain-containing protein n=1 Tax=Daldinia caldariorum TaxID=326644 RepID=UPI00200742C0|nr:Ppx/GppA phosphatase family-domain-containing protein [Daldinia caldariorum]KAI1467416.1 Ppx/GppA phosphatase family-domain-containing protein [Daldinia caldariorum]